MIGNINFVIILLIKTVQNLVRVGSGLIGSLQVFMVLAGVV